MFQFGNQESKLIQRLNFKDESWLSMQPGQRGVNVSERTFGEHNENKLHGRGICFWAHGDIEIGYFEDGEKAVGNYMQIDSDVRFSLGECYMKEGKKKYRVAIYRTDGSEEKSVYDF